MERRTVFIPAFDKRSEIPARNFGIHGVELRMFLVGELGAIQFVVYTNWMLPHVSKEMEHKDRWMSEPLPADIGYHAHTPQYEGQEPLTDKCEFTGGVCYYDGSGLQAREVFEILLREGSDGVWKEMERRYIEQFGELR